VIGPLIVMKAVETLVKRPIWREMMLDLTDEETDALARLLSRTYRSRPPTSSRAHRPLTGCNGAARPPSLAAP
jgi:hypothetical protein